MQFASMLHCIYLFKTSHATQWALYLLARNPEAQEQILREVNSVTGGEQVEEKHLTHLPYVKSVIKEALR